MQLEKSAKAGVRGASGRGDSTGYAVVSRSLGSPVEGSGDQRPAAALAATPPSDGAWRWESTKAAAAVDLNWRW